MKLKEYYTNESKWTQYTWFRNSESGATYHSEEAVCACLEGALSICYGGSEDYRKIRALIEENIPSAFGMNQIAAWNDDEQRTFDDVKALVEKLDI